MRHNWTEIQAYYDEGHSWREVKDKFKVYDRSLALAKNRGDLKTRTKSEANKLAHAKYPNSFTRTKETRNKISESRIKYIRDNPDKAPYKLNHYSKGRSYPEQYFYDWLTKEGIAFEEQKQVSLYQLDFAFSGMIDLEIDGEQHYLDNKIVESDKRRTEYLESQGWTIIRVRWSDYQRMTPENKEQYLKYLKQSLI